MKARALLFLLLCAFPAHADVEVDVESFGNSLGGWKARKGKAAEYVMSDATYRTYQPEISPSPDGGIFVSVRIDHVRGFMASDDHASLELSFSADGALVSAQSSLALQGRTISSELIRGGASATTSVAAPQIDQAVKIGTDLVADLSSKLLREKIVEPGRVSFPAAIRHNYNLLYQAVKRVPAKPAAAATPPAAPGTPPPGAVEAPAPPPPPVPAPNPPPAAAPSQPAQAAQGAKNPAQIPLPEIKPYNPSGAPTTPIPPKKDQSLLIKYGDDVLKLARDVVRSEMK